MMNKNIYILFCGQNRIKKVNEETCVFGDSDRLASLKRNKGNKRNRKLGMLAKWNTRTALKASFRSLDLKAVDDNKSSCAGK